MEQKQQQKFQTIWNFLFEKNFLASSSIEQHLKISRGLFSEQKQVNMWLCSCGLGMYSSNACKQTVHGLV
jgi:hypothetical protein